MDLWVTEEHALMLRTEPPVVPLEGRLLLCVSVVVIRLLLPRVSYLDDLGLVDCETEVSFTEARPEFVAVVRCRELWPDSEYGGEWPGERSGDLAEPAGDAGEARSFEEAFLRGGEPCCDIPGDD